MKIWPTNGGCLWQFPQKRLNFWGGKSLQPWVYDPISRSAGTGRLGFPAGHFTSGKSTNIIRLSCHDHEIPSFFNAVVNPRSASFGGFLKSGYPQSSSIWKIGIFPDFPSISIGLSLINQPFWGYPHDYGPPQWCPAFAQVVGSQTAFALRTAAPVQIQGRFVPRKRRVLEGQSLKIPTSLRSGKWLNMVNF